MSLKLLARCWDVQKVSPRAKAVLLAMADHAWEDGSHVHPSRGLIAHKTSMSLSTVDRGIEELVYLELIAPVSKTGMGVNIYKIAIDQVALMAFDFRPKVQWGSQVDEGISQIEDRASQDDDTPSQVDERTLTTPLLEPTYIADDENGVPQEHLMLYSEILDQWKRLLPKKTQPLATNRKLQLKVKSRMKDPTFAVGVASAIVIASKNTGLVKDSWFQLEYLLRNDDNWRKVAGHEFDWKHNGKQVADPVQLAPQKARTINRVDWVAPEGSV